MGVAAQDEFCKVSAQSLFDFCRRGGPFGTLQQCHVVGARSTMAKKDLFVEFLGMVQAVHPVQFRLAQLRAGKTV